jgi:hypothetical protein
MEKAQDRQPVFPVAESKNLNPSSYTIPLSFIPADHGYIVPMICQPVGHESLLALDTANMAGINTGHGSISVMGHKTDMN